MSRENRELRFLQLCIQQNNAAQQDHGGHRCHPLCKRGIGNQRIRDLLKQHKYGLKNHNHQDCFCNNTSFFHSVFPHLTAVRQLPIDRPQSYFHNRCFFIQLCGGFYCIIGIGIYPYPPKLRKQDAYCCRSRFPHPYRRSRRWSEAQDHRAARGEAGTTLPSFRGR